ILNEHTLRRRGPQYVRDGRARGPVESGGNAAGGGASSARIRRRIGPRKLRGLDGLRFFRRRRGCKSLGRTIAQCGRDALNLYAGDALAVHFDNRETMISELKAFAAARNETELVEDETADRGIRGIFRKGDVVLRVEIADVQRGIENDGAIGERERALDNVKFIVNFSYDLLEDVFQCDQAQNAAEFIDHDGQADVTRSQLQQQLARGFGLWDDEHFAQHAA